MHCGITKHNRYDDNTVIVFSPIIIFIINIEGMAPLLRRMQDEPINNIGVSYQRKLVEPIFLFQSIFGKINIYVCILPQVFRLCVLFTLQIEGVNSVCTIFNIFIIDNNFFMSIYVLLLSYIIYLFIMKGKIKVVCMASFFARISFFGCGERSAFLMPPSAVTGTAFFI